MSQATLDVSVKDGGIGYTGPDVQTSIAAIGVASGAAASVSAQTPVVISSVSDVETLIGYGPLRDLCVQVLSRAGCQILAFPLRKTVAGSTVPGSLPDIGGQTAVITGWSYSRHEVTLEVITAGDKNAAELRLVVDGIPQTKFKMMTRGSSQEIPSGSQGPLTRGDAPGLQINLPDADLALGKISWQMGEAKATAANITAAITPLVASTTPWEGVAIAGYTAPATWTALQTAIRALPRRGRYPWVAVQAAGHDLKSGAATEVTVAVWKSALEGASTPPRESDPRLTISAFSVKALDPITRREVIIPGLYPALGHLARRRVHEPPDATKYDPILNLDNDAIYPTTLDEDDWNALDNKWYMTLCTYPGMDGVYITHWRMWGQYPVAASGITGSDMTGIERRRVMDKASRSVYRALFRRLNGDVETEPNGRMSSAERTQWSQEATAGLQLMVNNSEIVAAEAQVRDKDPGILKTGVILVDVSIVPRGKAEAIRATLAYRVANITVEEAA